ncbi:hypothetical protein [Mucilaginibacter sp.]
MTLSDVSILGKKILVGIIITIIPFVIVAGGLWLTQKALGGNPQGQQHDQKTTKTYTP